LRLRALVSRFRQSIPLAIVLFVFWLIFTAKTNWHHLLLGAAASIIVSFFSSYLLAGRLDPHLNTGFAIRFPVFATLLFWEIIKANWDVLKRVFAPSFPISPRIVEFESYLESDIARTILANSITLTPGTVTIEIEGSRFYIHCLAEDFTEDPGSGTLQRMTAWLLGEGPQEMRRLR
jgi:multicomponent Na+:H+ antiporter subunit E